MSNAATLGTQAATNGKPNQAPKNLSAEEAKAFRAAYEKKQAALSNKNK